MTKRTHVHRKLLLEHKNLSDKYKLLRAKLSQVADSESKAEGLEKRISEIEGKSYLFLSTCTCISFLRTDSVISAQPNRRSASSRTRPSSRRSKTRCLG